MYIIIVNLNNRRVQRRKQKAPLISVVPCLFQFKTNYEKRSFKVPIQSNETLLGAVINNVSEAMETLTRITEEMVPVPGSVNGVNALGLVVFSMCFGFVIGNMKEQGQALREFFDSLNEAIMRLVAVIMWYVFPFAMYAMYEMLIASNMCSVLRKMPPGRMASCSDLIWGKHKKINDFLGL